MEPQAEPRTDWARHALRVADIIDNQVRSLRKRDLIASFGAGIKRGAYWGIQTDMGHFGLVNALPCPLEKTILLAKLETRLKRLAPEVQERLINWGYAACDAALRRHVDPTLPAPQTFPYPASGLG